MVMWNYRRPFKWGCGSPSSPYDGQSVTNPALALQLYLVHKLPDARRGLKRRARICGSGVTLALPGDFKEWRPLP